jgi:hypothetical protein
MAVWKVTNNHNHLFWLDAGANFKFGRLAGLGKGETFLLAVCLSEATLVHRRPLFLEHPASPENSPLNLVSGMVRVEADLEKGHKPISIISSMSSYQHGRKAIDFLSWALQTSHSDG